MDNNALWTITAVKPDLKYTKLIRGAIREIRKLSYGDIVRVFRSSAGECSKTKLIATQSAEANTRNI